MAKFCNREWDMVDQAYVTLLSSFDYLEGVLVLHRSLRAVKAQYPLLVLVTENVATAEILSIFEDESIFYDIVEPLAYTAATQDKWKHSSVLNTASKVHLFSQVNWKKLVYIDADVLVLENIDDLFLRLDGSMVKYPGDPHGFTGMFVVEPLLHDEADFYITLLKHEECFDGDLIGKLWFFLRTNPDYWIPPCYLHSPMEYTNASKTIHFCNEGKPWKKVQLDTGTFLMWKYNSFLQEIREKYDTAHYSLG